jgi:hypothetical protein
MQLIRFLSLFIFAVTLSAAAILPEPGLERRQCLSSGGECFLDDPNVCCSGSCDCDGPCSIFQEESIEPGVSNFIDV